ncbi:hypothetical protein PHIN3_183 [Sinorhizobium phage phiN3]|uniref:Uncharacterized protein n=1 Tax=Sinorhizobium phage phiN3 TaxID=1647405 RepID=A0A0F6WCK3_9CAUD|nr:RNA-binding protein [Sinorhizobium phage phiN3]AKF13446.1 hypothetical protein PHIN3_183 [Sinorhizobium phage phiN3]
MNAFVNAITETATTTRTENGALTYSTSLDACVDMFFQIGAIRGQGAARAEKLFREAYKANPDIASKIALWSRDVRGGAGERQVFRDLLKLLEKVDTDRLARIIPLVPEIGRWDDLFVFETKTAKNMAYSQIGLALTSDNPGLVAKWMPRETGAKKALARELMAFFELTPKQYRRLIVSLSNTVEQKMSAKLWDDIEFSHVPSVAAARYSKAFRKHQPDRYNEFVQKAISGEVKINTKALFPYDVTKSAVDAETANALWKNLPDYVPEGKSFIPMLDRSGSMWFNEAKVTKTMYAGDVADSIALYLAERNKSAFQNLILAFATQPSWVRLPVTDSLRAKQDALLNRNFGTSTNIDAGFREILRVALENNVSPEEMPEYLVVLSDMEFNTNGAGNTNAAAATKLFEANGYKAPVLVWWNIASRNGVVPVRANEKGHILVSGFSPTVVKSVLAGGLDPISVMLETVDIERYEH